MKSKLIVPGILAAGIAAVIPFAASAAPANLTAHEVAMTRAQAQSDPVHRIIVNYREGSQARSNSALAVQGINRALSRSGLAAQVQGGSVSHVRKLATGHDLFSLPAEVDRMTANAIFDQLAADPDVVWVEVDEIMQITADFAPNLVPDDPGYANYHWHYHVPDGNSNNFDSVSNQGGANLPDAWDLADGTGITIAIIDTGLVEHPDIDSSMGDAGYDFIIDGMRSGRGTDGRAPGGWDLGDWTIGYPGADLCTQRWSNWHGTHVAGTAGAQIINNGVALSGVAHNAQIVPVRVLGHCGGTLADVADAVVWASGGEVAGVPANANPAHIINMSLGGGGACTANSAMGMAIAGAVSNGTAVVVSAGNANSDTANYQPASCPGAIAVASTGITSRRATYSNWGSRVDIAAPGGGVYANDGSSGTQVFTGFVWQTTNPGQTTPEPVENPNAISGFAGTSQAAPHVAGVIAMMQSARLAAGLPLLTPAEALAIIQDTATPFAITPEASRPIGPGIVNAAAAVAVAACDDDDCMPAPPPPAAATPIFNRIPVTGLSGAQDSETMFMLEVPANVSGPVSILTNGGSGDVALYVSYGGEPTADVYDARSTRRGNNETVRFNNPQPGTYFIMLRGEPRNYANVTLRAVFNLNP